MRDANIDLVRALAISMVLLHHLTQPLPWSDAMLEHTKLGMHGVDLFFVLSGWLIGGLYWREHAAHGNVEIRRFWLRRWMRTIPPYLVVLPIAWLAVYLLRGERLHWEYLLFLQNYLEPMPYFTISWSLCVEEHFYLLLPLLLAAALRFSVPIPVLLPLLLTLAVIARFLDPAVESLPSSFSATATHLRMEGLLLGVWLAFLQAVQSPLWARLRTAAPRYLLPLLLLCLTMPWWDRWSRIYLEPTIVSMACGALLIALVERPELAVARLAGVRFLALTSYSVYLSHALLINVGILAADRFGIPRLWVAPILLLLILLTGYLMYRWVECTAISWRDRLVPRRAPAGVA